VGKKEGIEAGSISSTVGKGNASSHVKTHRRPTWLDTRKTNAPEKREIGNQNSLKYFKALEGK